jgi:hypothetical protein
MTNTILTLQRAARLTCFWVRTGNPRNPLACVWAETKPRSNYKEASSSNNESGGMQLCA